MKKYILILMVVFPALVIHGQDEVESPDRVRFQIDVAGSFSTFKLMGTTDEGNGVVTIIDNHEVTKAPVYKHTTTRLFALNGTFHFGLNIPFYKNENWSTGLKTNLGFGYQNGLFDEDFSSLILDLPQFLYFRNYKTDFDYTVFAGYKYTWGPVPYGLFILGADYNLSKRSALRVYFSPFRRTYYWQYSNGEYKPAIRVVEFGVGLVL